jgi:hypothetical protein
VNSRQAEVLMPDTGFTIHPTGIYTSDDLCAMLDVSLTALTEARRSGALRWARKGRRVIFLGEWIITWLQQGARQEVVDATS